jgi:hypothetical protein
MPIPKNKISQVRLLHMVGTALLAACPMLCGAQVYKCTENGSVTFQSDPCKSAGTLMHLESGPTEQAILDAQNRAEKDKKSAWTKPASPAPSRNGAPESHPPDCSKLNQAVADAEGKRAQLMEGSWRPGGTDAGTRNINRLSGPIDQQYNYAKNIADASGCH